MSAQRNTHTRALLALDGSDLGHELLANVLRHCVHLCPRLDILLINPPREPTTLLAILLPQLEHSGIDYRVALANAVQLGDEATRLIDLKGHEIV